MDNIQLVNNKGTPHYSKMGVERGRASQRSHLGGVGSQRSSQRSYGTSSSESGDSRARCKDCCRKFITFMCTQVGVGGLVVTYAIMGSFAFIAIESKPDFWRTNSTSLIHNETIKVLWNFTERLNVLHKEKWKADVNDSLFTFQERIVREVKDTGYDGRSHDEVWTFSAALMFCLSIFTMIGYGHMTPRTEWGKIAVIFYAILGIPLYIVYFMNMGRVFAKSFKFLYRTMHRCVNRNKRQDTEETELAEEPLEEPAIIVPSTACIWVMIFYMTTGTIMFAEWENWSYLNSCYFSFTSLAKIGIGDFVPGFGGVDGATEDSQTKLIINFMYLLVGMGLIAMCYTLMKEEIMLKLRTLKQELKEKIFYCGVKLGLYQDDQEVPKDYYRQPPHIRTKSVRKSVRRR